MHHIGIVVKDLGKATRHYEVAMSAVQVASTVRDPVQLADIAFVKIPGNNVLVELIAPYAEEAPVTGFLKHRGGGLHHVCYSASDIRTTQDEWRKDGAIPVFGPVPALAFGGSPILFMYLRDRSLVELVEGSQDVDPVGLLKEG